MVNAFRKQGSWYTTVGEDGNVVRYMASDNEDSKEFEIRIRLVLIERTMYKIKISIFGYFCLFQKINYNYKHYIDNKYLKVS